MTNQAVIKVTSADSGLEWSRRGTQDLMLADAIGEADGAAMTVGFATYAAGESNEWDMVYDEALVIIAGRFAVDSRGTTTEGQAGDVIYLTPGTPVVYRAIEDSQLVYVAHPHWVKAIEHSRFAERLQEFTPVSARG